MTGFQRTVGAPAAKFAAGQAAATPIFRSDLIDHGGPKQPTATQYVIMLNCPAAIAGASPNRSRRSPTFRPHAGSCLCSTISSARPERTVIGVADAADGDARFAAGDAEPDAGEDHHSRRDGREHLTGGYDKIFHLFLPPGQQTCFDAPNGNQCYSPSNPSTFVFCAYHSATTFIDIGHVIYSIEPYQNVYGCANAAPSSPATGRGRLDLERALA